MARKTTAKKKPAKRASKSNQPHTNLDIALVEELRGLWRTRRRATLEIARIAFELKLEYGEYNEKGKFEYNKDFKAFYHKELASIFGAAMSSFSRYASIGEAIDKVSQRFGDRFTDKLPSSFEALYQISQLTDEEFGLCIEDTFSRDKITDVLQSQWKRKNSKKKTPLITPTVTAASIRSWREKWNNPKQKKEPAPYYRVAYQIQLPADFTKMNEDGTPMIADEQVKEFSAFIEKVAKNISDLKEEGNIDVALTSKMDAVTDARAKAFEKKQKSLEAAAKKAKAKKK